MRDPSNQQAHRAVIIEAIRVASNGGTTVSVESAGQLLGSGRDGAYAAVRSGRLPVIRVNPRKWRVSVAVLERLLLGE